MGAGTAIGSRVVVSIVIVSRVMEQALLRRVQARYLIADPPQSQP